LCRKLVPLGLRAVAPADCGGLGQRRDLLDPGEQRLMARRRCGLARKLRIDCQRGHISLSNSADPPACFGVRQRHSCDRGRSMDET